MSVLAGIAEAWNQGADDEEKRGQTDAYQDRTSPVLAHYDEVQTQERQQRDEGMCCNFQKAAGGRLVGSTGRRLMQLSRTVC